MNIRARILVSIAERPGQSDREITDRLLGAQAGQQQVNQVCRLLEAEGVLKREKMPGGRIGNFPLEDYLPPRPETIAAGPPLAASYDGLSEDAVKALLEDWLRSDGWTPTVAWGHAFGIDIEARRGSQRWVIEVKGSGSRQPMRVNYFLAILGELLQRMDDPDAAYSIAMPDMPQYRGLWNRLPRLAKERLGITALFIDDAGAVSEN